MLPKGQFDLKEFPRFGLPDYQDRFPDVTDRIEVKIGGDVEAELQMSERFHDLPRHTQTSDFHCVTTWSTVGLNWEGVLFRDFFEKFVVPQAVPVDGVAFVNIKCQDGYRSCLPLRDMLRDNVLLADHLSDKPLPIAHGAPLRLVAPDHYGYKNAKHISEINFHREQIRPKTALTRFLAHPRGRVDHEERGVGVPGWILRYLYRPLVGSTKDSFATALARHLDVEH